MIRRAMLLLAASIAFAFTLASCGGDGDDRGALLIARGDAVGTWSIIEYDIASGSESTLVTPPADRVALRDPALSPDGTRIAFVALPPLQQTDGVLDVHSDLWIAARDGSGARVAYQHSRPNELMERPQWLDDTRVLVVVRSANSPTDFASFKYRLERVHVETGERATVRDDVLAHGLSRDRAEMVYAKWALAGVTIERARSDGGDASVVVAADAGLRDFDSPRFSPDGKTIALSARDEGDVLAPASPERLVSARPHSPSMHSSAEHVFLVPADGGSATEISGFEEDGITVAWDRGGDHLYVFGEKGLYVYDAEASTVTRLADGFGHTQIVWAPSR